eukprot:971876_1
MLRSKCLKSTTNHIIEKEQEIETDMHLDGLSASHECVLTNKHIGLSNSYHKKQISIDFPKALNGKRDTNTGASECGLIEREKNAKTITSIEIMVEIDPQYSTWLCVYC